MILPYLSPGDSDPLKHYPDGLQKFCFAGYTYLYENSNDSQDISFRAECRAEPLTESMIVEPSRTF